MKKTVLMIALLGVFCGALSAQQITVTSPAAGVSWEAGKLHDIIWTKSGTLGDRVLIRLRNAGGVALDIVMDTANNGLYCWTIPATLTPGQYYVRVRTLTDLIVNGDSGMFTITAPLPPSLALKSPRGGESWELGSTQKIQWLATNIQTNCRLVLLKDGLVKGTIRDPFAPGQGENIWNWVVGTYQGGPAIAGGGYKVRMELIDGSLSTQSETSFTIAPKTLLFVTQAKIEAQGMLIGSPDLVVCAEWSSKRPQLGDKRTVTVKVKNKGTAPSLATNFDFYVEGHGTRSFPLPALAVNAEYSFAHKFWWQSWGHKTVRITIDPANQVAESNENNNKVSGSIEVILWRDGYGFSTSRCSDGTQAPQ